MYISASLPERYGVFNDIRKDNFPFNQTFSQYVELIAQIGIYHKMNIVEVIGYIEDGIMGDERLPDIPEGNELVQFRFKTNSEVTEQFYKAQEITNRQVTMLIIMMTLRLSNRYGTSLHRIYSRIEAVSGFSKQKKRAIRADRHVQAEPEVREEVVVEKPKPKVQIKKKKRVVPKEEAADEKLDEVIHEDEEVISEEPEEIVKEETPPTDDIVARMERLTKQGQQLLDKRDEHDDDVVVETNPALGDFFHTD